MKSIVIIIAIVISLMSVSEETIATSFDWPDVVQITWNYADSVNCFDGLVYCLLAATADSSDFVDSVSAKGHSIWWWNSDRRSCIVEIASTQDLATEATYYKNSSLTRYGGPCILLGGDFWPSDEFYDDAEIHEQWNLTSAWHPEGYNEDVHINWNPVAEEMNNWDDEGVVIGIIDEGVNWDDVVLHPDLANANRITIGNFFDGSDIDEDNPHGTAVATVISSEANNSFGGINNEWGMVGVNPISELVIYKGNSDRDLGVFVGIECEAFFDLVTNHHPQAVNYSRGLYYEPDNEELMAEVIGLWEMAFTDLMDAEEEMPLLVCASGNADHGNDQVAYPAMLAYNGFAEGFENGYPFVMSISGINTDGNRQYSSDNNLKHVSLVAPSDEILVGWDPEWWHVVDLPEEYEDYFFFWTGTSFAAPQVSGAAGLVFNVAFAAGETPNAWTVRRILEKTATDINNGNNPVWDDPFQGVDDEMGYGILNCDLAVNNRHLYEWNLNNATWYYISCRIAPVFDDVTRILEDITLDNADTQQRLDVIQGWDPDTQTETAYDFDAETNTMAAWNVERMYKIKLQNAGNGDSLLICGQEVSTDLIGDDEYWDEIDLFDNAQSSGWNWAAYYPEDSRSARDALEGDEGIAVWNNPAASDLYLAKGANGNFYAPDFQFNNLTMQPGQGYQMQLNNNQNVTLRYSVEGPGAAPRRPNDGTGKRIATTQHFRFQEGTGDFLPILISQIQIPDREPSEGDEIGIFVSDSLCVGGAVWHDGIIGFAAWKNDETTDGLDGYGDFNSLTFRYWVARENIEISEISIQTASAQEEPSLWLKELNFGGSIREPIIPSSFEIGPIYPNPFNSRAVLHYSVQEPGSLKLTIHNALGKEIVVLQNGYVEAGRYRMTVNADDYPSGIYFLLATTSHNSAKLKFLLIR